MLGLSIVRYATTDYASPSNDQGVVEVEQPDLTDACIEAFGGNYGYDYEEDGHTYCENSFNGNRHLLK